MKGKHTELPAGYLLPEGWTMKDVLRIDAELLASEGIDLKEELDGHQGKGEGPSEQRIEAGP